MNFKILIMKNIFKLFILPLFLLLIFSCTKTEKYEGTPLSNNQNVETITGLITSTTAFALPGQLVDFTVTLPQEFVDRVDQDVNIEVLTTTLGGSLRRSTVKLLKGQTVVSGKVLIGGGDGTFFMPVSLKLNAVKLLANEIPNKHFLLTSNSYSIDSGSSSIPADNDKRLQIRVSWENQTTGSNNFFECKLTRVSSSALTLKGSAVSNNNVKIGTVSYPISLSTDLKTAADNFVITHKVNILANHNIVVSSYGKSIFFDYSTANAPVITIASVGVTPNLGGFVFNSVITNSSIGVSTNDYPILNSQLTSTTNSGFENTGAAYNIGNYKLSIRPKLLQSTPLDLKYRVIVKKPDGTVFVFNDMYSQATTSSPFIDVLSFTKVGYDENADYINITH